MTEVLPEHIRLGIKCYLHSPTADLTAAIDVSGRLNFGEMATPGAWDRLTEYFIKEVSGMPHPDGGEITDWRPATADEIEFHEKDD